MNVLSILLAPRPSDLPPDGRAPRPVLAGALLMVGASAAHAMVAPHSDPTGWGAYRGDRVAAGEWWRIITYTFLYEQPLALASDALAVTVCGTALTRLQSPALGFAAFRLGMFAALLGVLRREPRDQPVTSLSGPAYCMLGAALASAALRPARVRPALSGGPPALAAGLAALLGLAARPFGATATARRAQVIAFSAGAVAAALAELVRTIEA